MTDRPDGVDDCPGPSGARALSPLDVALSALAARERARLLRRRRVVDPVDAVHVRVDGRLLTQFSGNDSLGLTHHPAIVESLRSATAAGIGAAALIAGHTRAHERAEQAVARWKGVDDAVLLPSGYQANVAAVQTLAGIGGVTGRPVRFLVDKLVHASLVDAVRSTECETRIFPHNGIVKLERLLEDSDRFDVVVTESIFSMDGDRADLPAIARLKRHARFALLVDEAHASGIYGPGGAGVVSELGLTAEVDLGVATFSKAAGVIGGAVYGSRAMVESVVNFGRAYVYTTSPPASVAAAVEASVDAMCAADDRRSRLRANVDRLRAGIASLGLSTLPGDSPIVPVLLGDESAALAAAARLFDAGYLVVAVRPPTVPKGTSRLRLTVSSEHTTHEIDGLLGALRT